jgi:hypothetical protein
MGYDGYVELEGVESGIHTRSNGANWLAAIHSGPVRLFSDWTRWSLWESAPELGLRRVALRPQNGHLQRTKCRVLFGATMKVFLSWSGDRSKAVAAGLRVWLSNVIQALDPFLSSHDIAKGEVWLLRILQELDESSFGIICVTEDNIRSEWLNFEAGALAKHLGRGRVCPFLLDVKPQDLRGPLSEFQSTTFVKEEVARLLAALNNALGKLALPNDRLAEQFELWWDNLNEKLRHALAIPKIGRSELQELTEDLLLPVIYRETLNGEIGTVFDWLDLAEKKHTILPGGELSVVEAALARVAGKKGAGKTLRNLTSNGSAFVSIAWLEYLFLGFAIPCQRCEILKEPRVIDVFPETQARTAYALLGLWEIREGNPSDAAVYLRNARPGQLTGDSGDNHRALPLGLLCLALGDAENAEFHLDRLKRGATARHQGYPFLNLTEFLDVEFLNTLFRGIGKISEAKIREFRGHAWVLIRFAELVRTHPSILGTLHSLSVGKKWGIPLTSDVVGGRLRQLEKAFASASGAPFSLR